MITQFENTKTETDGEVTSTNQPGWTWKGEIFDTANFETWVASLNTSSDSYTVRVTVEVFKNRS